MNVLVKRWHISTLFDKPVLAMSPAMYRYEMHTCERLYEEKEEDYLVVVNEAIHRG